MLDHGHHAVTYDTGEEPDQERRKRLYEAGRGRDGYQSRNASRYSAQHTRLAGADPFDQRPAQRSRSRAEVCRNECAGGQTGSRDRAAGVKPEPAEPQQASANDAQDDAVRLHRLGWITDALAEV